MVCVVKDMRSCVKRREVSVDLEVYVFGVSKILGYLILVDLGRDGLLF